jgi:hypothetical protein
MELLTACGVVAVVIALAVPIVRWVDGVQLERTQKNQKIKDLERALRDANLRAERSIDWQD